MLPRINASEFGSITINGITYDHDVIICLDGSVQKRKKTLSKQVYGTSHKISLAEIKYIYEKGAEKIIIGSGQHGQLQLSDEAIEYLGL